LISWTFQLKFQHQKLMRTQKMSSKSPEECKFSNPVLESSFPSRPSLYQRSHPFPSLSRIHSPPTFPPTSPLSLTNHSYVGNLSWRTTWQDLKDYFSQVGTVRYADVMREAGPGSRSKGCGIVEFETAEEAAAAIQTLNHTDLGSRQIFVREDREDYELKSEGGGGGREHPSRPSGGGIKRPAFRQSGPAGGGGRGGGGGVMIGRKVFVGNLSYETTWQEIKDHFRQAGNVMHADILSDSEGKSKGCAIVEFSSPADALRAISLLSNSTLNDRQISVREDREDPVGAQRGVGGKPGFFNNNNNGNGNYHNQRPMHPPAPEGCQVVIHGLPYSMAWQELKDFVRQPGGNVIRADVMTGPDGRSKGYGIAVFGSPDEADAAIQQLSGQTLEGRIVTLKLDKFAGGN